jgi:hypothetical protein
MTRYLRDMRLNGESSDDEYEEIVIAHIEQSINEERPHRRGSIKGIDKFHPTALSTNLRLC